MVLRTAHYTDPRAKAFAEYREMKKKAMVVDPKVIAAFRTDNGRKLRGYPVDRVEWRRVAPDVQTGVNEQGEPVYGRPMLNDFRQVHGWLGHPMDDEQDED